MLGGLQRTQNNVVTSLLIRQASALNTTYPKAMRPRFPQVLSVLNCAIVIIVIDRQNPGYRYPAKDVRTRAGLSPCPPNIESGMATKQIWPKLLFLQE